MDIIVFFSNFKFTNELWILILPVASMGIDFITGLTKRLERLPYS